MAVHATEWQIIQSLLAGFNLGKPPPPPGLAVAPSRFIPK